MCINKLYGSRMCINFQIILFSIHIPEIILPVWFILNKPQQIKSGEKCGRQLNILFDRFLGVIASICRISSGKNRNTSIQTCHYTSLKKDGSHLKYNFSLMKNENLFCNKIIYCVNNLHMGNITHIVICA